MQAVSTVLAVLESVITDQPVGVSELARRLDIPKSTAQRALKALESEGWVQRDPQGGSGWVQTSKIWVLASRGTSAGLRGKALEVMHELLAEVNENVHLTVRQDDTIVVLEKVECDHPVRVFDPFGTEVRLHASGSGKAILAWAGEDAIEAYLQRQLIEYTDETITDPDALRDELAQIRERGYARNRGEWRSEIRGVAVPIFDGDGPPRFGMALSVPSHRLPEEKVAEYAERLMAAGQRLSGRL